MGDAASTISPGLMQAGEVPLTTSEAATSLNLPSAAKIKPHFFDETGLGSKLIRGLGEFALQYSAGQGNAGAMAMLQHRYRSEEQAAEEKRYRARQDAQQQLDARKPIAIGDNLIRLNPTTGQYETMFRAPVKASAPTAMQQNYEFLQSTDPSLAQSYLQGQANPVQWMRSEGSDGSINMYPVPRSGYTPSQPQGAPLTSPTADSDIIAITIPG